MSSRAIALSLIAALALASCGRPGSERPAAPQAQPSKPTPPAAPPSGQATPAAGPAALQQHLRSAEDLFNRGENDLACEQVKQASALAGSSATPASAPAPASASGAASEQLQRFQQACSQQP